MSAERSATDQELLDKLARQPAGLTLVELSKGKDTTEGVRKSLVALEREGLVCEYRGSWFLGTY